MRQNNELVRMHLDASQASAREKRSPSRALAACPAVRVGCWAGCKSARKKGCVQLHFVVWLHAGALSLALTQLECTSISL